MSKANLLIKRMELSVFEVRIVKRREDGGLDESSEMIAHVGTPTDEEIKKYTSALAVLSCKLIEDHKIVAKIEKQLFYELCKEHGTIAIIAED